MQRSEVEIASEKFRPTMVVTSALTTEAILGGDFPRENDCTLEMGKRILRFINRGVAITLNRASMEPVIIQARVTLGETVRIPSHSEKDVVARIDKPVKAGTWLLEGDKSGRLLVSIANTLVSATSPYVHVRMLNTHSDSIMLVKGTKIGAAEEVTESVTVAAVGATQDECTPVSERQCKMLWETVESSGEDELTAEQKEQFYALLLANSDLFSFDGQLGRTGLVKYHVDTGRSASIRQPLRRIPPFKLEEARHLLQDMLSKDIIRPSSSPWASPIILVPKKRWEPQILH